MVWRVVIWLIQITSISGAEVRETSQRATVPSGVLVGTVAEQAFVSEAHAEVLDGSAGEPCCSCNAGVEGVGFDSRGRRRGGRG